jgi:hypothetical protein
VPVFLLVRWIEYCSEDQVIPGQPDYDEKISQELESDRKQFQYFLKFVEEQGAPLSEDKVEFGWQKELDPLDDWRTVRFLLPTQRLHTVAHIHLYLVCSIEVASVSYFFLERRLLFNSLCILPSMKTTQPELFLVR